MRSSLEKAAFESLEKIGCNVIANPFRGPFPAYTGCATSVVTHARVERPSNKPVSDDRPSCVALMASDSVGNGSMRSGKGDAREGRDTGEEMGMGGDDGRATDMGDGMSNGNILTSDIVTRASGVSNCIRESHGDSIETSAMRDASNKAARRRCRSGVSTCDARGRGDVRCKVSSSDMSRSASMARVDMRGRLVACSGDAFPCGGGAAGSSSVSSYR